MDDLSGKLTDLLNDPESMERIKQMAESILGGGSEEPQKPSVPTGIAGIGDALAGEDIGKIISVISKMKTAENDSRIQLIYALKPHLSTERQARADTAVKILKLLDILPAIKESGLLV